MGRITSGQCFELDLLALSLRDEIIHSLNEKVSKENPVESRCGKREMTDRG